MFVPAASAIWPVRITSRSSKLFAASAIVAHFTSIEVARDVVVERMRVQVLIDGRLATVGAVSLRVP